MDPRRRPSTGCEYNTFDKGFNVNWWYLTHIYSTWPKFQEALSRILMAVEMFGSRLTRQVGILYPVKVSLPQRVTNAFCTGLLSGTVNKGTWGLGTVLSSLQWSTKIPANLAPGNYLIRVNLFHWSLLLTVCWNICLARTSRSPPSQYSPVLPWVRTGQGHRQRYWCSFRLLLDIFPRSL